MLTKDLNRAVVLDPWSTAVRTSPKECVAE